MILGDADTNPAANRLKCDKGHPCDSCSKRGEESSCSYRREPNTARTKNVPSGNTSQAQERLQQLEGLVMQLMQSGTPSNVVSVPASLRPMRCAELGVQASSNSPTRDSGRTLEKDFKAIGGLLTADGSEPSYVGATHWAAILDNVQHPPAVHTSMANPASQIKELKSDLGSESSPTDDDDLAEDNPRVAQEDSIFGLISPPSLENILQSLPPRQMTDRRLSLYFKSKNTVIRKCRAALHL